MSGPQKWALILPSSARVSLVTYTAVIAVRYPELDNVQNDLICFGNYLLGEQATSGLNHCSCRSSGSTPFTEKCLTRLLDIDLASLWSLDELRVGW